MKNKWPEKIRNIRKELKLNQVSFAKELGTSQVYISQLESGHKNPGRELLESLVSLGITPNYLLSNDSDHPVMDGIPDHGSILIPIIAYAQCGPGGVNSDVYDEKIALPQVLYHSKIKQKETFALRAVGESMEPEIHSGDIVIFRKQKEIEHSKVMALTYQSEPMIKKVEISNGIVNLISFNFDRYSPILVTNANDLFPHGTALGVIRKYN